MRTIEPLSPVPFSRGRKHSTLAVFSFPAFACQARSSLPSDLTLGSASANVITFNRGTAKCIAEALTFGATPDAAKLVLRIACRRLRGVDQLHLHGR